jgi:hypothetical protein
MAKEKKLKEKKCDKRLKCKIIAALRLMDSILYT